MLCSKCKDSFTAGHFPPCWEQFGMCHFKCKWTPSHPDPILETSIPLHYHGNSWACTWERHGCWACQYLWASPPSQKLRKNSPGKISQDISIWLLTSQWLGCLRCSGRHWSLNTRDLSTHLTNSETGFDRKKESRKTDWRRNWLNT